MYTELAGALASLKAATDLALAAVSAQQRLKVQEALAEANQRLYGAVATALASQEEVATLKARAQELEQENLRLRDWSAEAERYSLEQVARGVFAYLEKGSMQPLEARVKLCPTCYQQLKKSVLQQQRVEVGRMIRLTCFSCKLDVTFQRYLESGEPPV